MTLLIYILSMFTCQMTVKIATPPMYKTDSTLTAILIIKDGTPPYTYAWNNGSTKDTAVYSKLAFSIICNVTDSKGCVVHDVLILGE